MARTKHRDASRFPSSLGWEWCVLVTLRELATTSCTLTPVLFIFEVWNLVLYTSIFFLREKLVHQSVSVNLNLWLLLWGNLLRWEKLYGTTYNSHFVIGGPWNLRVTILIKSWVPYLNYLDWWLRDEVLTKKKKIW